MLTKPDFVFEDESFANLAKLAKLHGEQLSIRQVQGGYRASVLVVGRYGSDLHRGMVTKEQAEDLCELAYGD